jgi:type IV secretion system protein VirD4
MRAMTDQPDRQGSGRRWLLSSAALGAVIVASAAATQYVAWRLSYHPALGSPWAGYVYAPWAWAGWMRAPWAGNVWPVFQHIGMAGMLAMGAGMLVLISRTSANRRKPVKHHGIHGTGRFQTPEEIRGGGLMARRFRAHEGVYVGGWADEKGRTHYLRHDGPEHCIVIGPTRSGKGIGNILPTLLSWNDSALVYDEKGELWALTAGWRSSEGGNVVLRWEPGSVAQSASFNFLEEIRLGTPYEVGDAQAIALAICDPKGEGLESKDHWTKSAWALIAGLALHVCYAAAARGQTGTLADIAAMLSDPDQGSDDLWEEMRTNQHGPNGTRHQTVAEAGQDMADRNEKERKSVLSSAKVFLTIYSDPVVASNSRRSDFKLIGLMSYRAPVSLYIVTRGTDKERLRPLVRLLLTLALRRLMGVELTYKNGQAIMPHKHRLLALIDEFPSLGRMEILEGSLPKAAAWGIKFFLAAQDRGQLFQAYGQYQSITGNCHIRIVYGPNEGSTADWISHDIGGTTLVKEDVTESGIRSGSLKNVSRTYHEISRPVMTPDEIMALRKPRKDDMGRIITSGQMIIFQAGERPILGNQIIYYIDPVFAERSRILAPFSMSLRRTP